MRRGFSGLVVILTLCFITPVRAATPPKLGDGCPKVGVVKNYKSVNFKCVRIGKKLIWRLSNKSTPTSLNRITNLNDFGPSTLCKLTDLTSDERVVSSGFPIKSDLLGKSNINLLGLYVDFTDLPGNVEPLTDSSPITQSFNNFYSSMSYGKVNFTWTIPNKYFHLKNSVWFYKFSLEAMNAKQPGHENIFKFPQDVINAADSEIDFSKFDALIIFTPPQATSAEIGDVSPGDLQGQIGYTSNDGPVRNIRTYVGAWRESNWVNKPLGGEYIWRGLAHEFGHILGLADYYMLDFINRFDSYIGQYDLMGVPQYGQAPELLGWSRWLLNWINDNQVICNKLTSSIISISPIELKDSKTKLVIIPISNSIAIGIESRRAIGFDSSMEKVSEGILVYRINTSKPTQKGPIQIQSIRPNPLGKWADQSNLFKDAPIKKGESIKLGNIEISVIDSTATSDLIQIKQ